MLGIPRTILVTTALLLVACSSEPSDAPGSGGSGGVFNTGGMASGGTADSGGESSGGTSPTGGAAPSAGSPPANGGSEPGGGIGAAAGMGPSGGGGHADGGTNPNGGAAAEGGNSAGSAGVTGGSGGSAGEVGGSSGAGGAPKGERLTCAAGPFPAPMVMSSKNVCQNFAFNHTYNEGPTWIASEKAFFFTNFVMQRAMPGDIIKYTPGVGCEIFIADVGCNGLAASIDGHLLAACHKSRSVLRFDVATKQATTIVDSYMGMPLDTPNDLIQHSNGTLYFTNPTYELDGRPVGVGQATFRIDPLGTMSLIRQGSCNGIALSPDESKLYVLFSGMWDLDAQGAPSNRQDMFTTGDGMAVDCAGNIYANRSIFGPGGNNMGSWGAGTNLAFGGEDGTTLLVVGPGTTVRELQMNVPGLP